MERGAFIVVEGVRDRTHHWAMLYQALSKIGIPTTTLTFPSLYRILSQCHYYYTQMNFFLSSTEFTDKIH